MAALDDAFNAAKELCRIGHPKAGCSYGGMSSAYGYWLADDDCPLNHGERCDLRVVCDGVEATTGFRGSEPDPVILYWIYAVMACEACAELYAAEHPEWGRQT